MGTQVKIRDKKKVKAQWANYYENHKEDVKRKNLEYYHSHKNDINAKRTAYKQSPKARYAVYKYNAKTRNIDFSISFEQFMSLWREPCFYCGLDIDGIGIDRKDNSVGYTFDNIVSCCFFCNRMKSDKGIEPFLERCNLIASLHRVEI